MRYRIFFALSLVVSCWYAHTHAACPDGLAGKLTTGVDTFDPTTPRVGFEWITSLGQHPIGAEEILTISFLIVPFEHGDTFVGMDEIGGRTGFRLDFKDGLVNGTVSYAPNAWNDITAEFNTTTGTYVVTVNGTPSSPQTMNYGDTQSVQLLRIHASRADQEGVIAWIDNISIALRSPTTAVDLFRESFEGSVNIDVYPGTVVSAPVPIDITVPPTCVIAVEDITWGQIKTLFR